MAQLCKDMQKCEGLKSISFSKNNLGADSREDNSSFDSGSNMGASVGDGMTSGMSSQTGRTNENLLSTVINVCEMVAYHEQMERLCLSYCFLHDNGMKILSDKLQRSNLRYVNISHNKLTAACTTGLCKFIRTNASLEKLFLHHNELGDHVSMTMLFNALKDNNKVQYLDISGNKVTAQSLKMLLTMQAKD